MATFIYTATDELINGRDAGDSVVLDLGVQEAVRSRSVEKSVQRSQGGAMEVLWHRADVTWTVTLEPVAGVTLDLVREFMASTEAGEVFTMDLYGTAAAPKAVKRIDDGYTEQPFLRVGEIMRDLFVVEFQVIEL
jgi:hypothetical protein